MDLGESKREASQFDGVRVGALTEVDQLVASAKLDGFKVTKEAADPITKVLEDFIDRIDTVKGEMRVFDQAPPLGDHDYGKKVAAHMYKAANDDRSARAALGRLQDILERIRDALLFASNQYKKQEESARGAFRNMGVEKR